METILLGFCLISLMITGLIVVVEVLRERKRFSKLSEEVELRQELRSLSKENFQVVEEESQPQISQRVFDVLRQQLKIFGYRSEEQQMLFLNRLLGSDHKVLSDLSPQEQRLPHELRCSSTKCLGCEFLPVVAVVFCSADIMGTCLTNLFKNLRPISFLHLGWRTSYQRKRRNFGSFQQ